MQKMISFPSEKSENPQDKTELLIAQVKNRTDAMKKGELPERMAFMKGEVRLYLCLRQLDELADTKPEAKQALDDFWNAFEVLVNHIVQKVKSGKLSFQFLGLREWQLLGHPQEGMTSMMMPYPEKIKKMLDEFPFDDLELRYFTLKVIQARELREKALQEKTLSDQITFGKKAIVKVTDPSGIPLEGQISGDFLTIEVPETSHIGREIRNYLQQSKKNPTDIGTSWKEIALFEGEEMYEVYIAARQFQQNPEAFKATLIQKRCFDRYQFHNRKLIAAELDLSTEEFEKFRRLLYL